MKTLKNIAIVASLLIAASSYVNAGQTASQKNRDDRLASHRTSEMSETVSFETRQGSKKTAATLNRHSRVSSDRVSLEDVATSRTVIKGKAGMALKTPFQNNRNS